MPQCLSEIETYICLRWLFFESLLTTFERSTIFLGNWGCTKIGSSIKSNLQIQLCIQLCMSKSWYTLNSTLWSGSQPGCLGNGCCKYLHGFDIFYYKCTTLSRVFSTTKKEFRVSKKVEKPWVGSRQLNDISDARTVFRNNIFDKLFLWEKWWPI